MREFELAMPIGRFPKREELQAMAAKKMGVSVGKVGECIVARRSVDARGKDILYRYKIEAYLKGEEVISKYVPLVQRDVSGKDEVIVIGAGPGGLFAALKLIELGLKPVIIERGKDVSARKLDIAALNRDGVLNSDSNYCFGEGGAGTFSDGKLYTRSVKRGNVFEVLSHLVDFGADESIMIEAHPHIGSDKLPAIIAKMREFIIESGGEFKFETRISGFEMNDGKIKSVVSDRGERFCGLSYILATGHSSNDVYSLLDSSGIALEAKGFAIGVRIEHPQSLINRIQYHGKYQPYMPTAEYSLVAQIEGRGVFSFCMCPGGTLVPSMTEEGSMVLNGMSNSSRSSAWANSGLVVSINPGDIEGYQKYGVMELLRFRSDVERAAFERGGDGFKAPAQRVTDFLKSRLSSNFPKTSYHPGVVSAELSEILTPFVSSRLKQAINIFDKKMRGFICDDSIMLAPESRTSSPVRILRDVEELHSVSCENLYPCGEGAGYAGGIVSSAIDGINVASKIATKLF